VENTDNFNKREDLFKKIDNTSNKHEKFEETVNSISDLERELESILSEIKESLSDAIDSIDNSQGIEDLKRDAKNIIQKINQDFQNVQIYRKEITNNTNFTKDEEE